MTIYRWEHLLTKTGPYSYATRKFRTKECQSLLEYHSSHLDQWPSIGRETIIYSSQEFDDSFSSFWGVIYGEEWLFGFDSMEQMEQWFSKAAQLILIASGFRLMSYKDKDVELIAVTTRQVIFKLRK